MMLQRRCMAVGLLLLLAVVTPVFGSSGQSLTTAQSYARIDTKRPSALGTTTNEKSHPEAVAAALQVRRGGNMPERKAITGVVIMTLIERVVNKIFKAQGISFPSQLGGCIALFVVLIVGDIVKPGLGESIFGALNPGAGLVAKWLPSLFVPGLAMLPLAPSIGDGFEIAKAFSVVLLGFFYSLSTVCYSVLFLRGAQGSIAKAAPKPRKIRKASAAPAAPAKPYSVPEMHFLIKGSVVLGVLSLLATNTGFEYAGPLSTIFFIVANFAAYVWGARLPTSFVKTVHPLITTTFLLWAIMYGVAFGTGSTFLDILKSFKVGSLDLLKAGAGDILLFLLGPSVVSFALSMYSRRKLLMENLPIVLFAGLLSSVGGMFGTAAFVRAIKLGGESGAMIRLSVLSRNVTTALSMAIASMLGGNISVAAVAVVFTGILGATYGRSLMDAMGIQDPVTRGLGLGAAAQGLGVSALVPEADAFPFAAMSMVLTAVFATTLASIPAINKLIVQLATGS